MTFAEKVRSAVAVVIVLGILWVVVATCATAIGWLPTLAVVACMAWVASLVCGND